MIEDALSNEFRFFEVNMDCQFREPHFVTVAQHIGDARFETLTVQKCPVAAGQVEDRKCVFGSVKRGMNTGDAVFECPVFGQVDVCLQWTAGIATPDSCGASIRNEDAFSHVSLIKDKQAFVADGHHGMLGSGEELFKRHVYRSCG